MLKNNRVKIKSINSIVAITVLIFCIFYIYQRFKTGGEDFPSIEEIRNVIFTKASVLLLLSVCLLTIANWYIESIKWKYLLASVQKISTKKAFIAVLMGLSITMIIPYRVGSFIGRVWNIDTKHRLSGILASIFGGLAQLFVTVVLGLLALVWTNYDLKGVPQNYVSSISIVLLLLVSFTYFFPSYIIALIKKIPAISQTSNAFSVLENYNLHKKLMVVMYSFIRYCIFIIQFYLILTVFDSSVLFFEVVFPLSLVFLILSIAPTIVFGLGVREFSALLLLSPMYATASAVLVASVSIWLVNMILPALVGAFFFMVTKRNNG